MAAVIFKSKNFGDVTQASEIEYWQFTVNRTPKRDIIGRDVYVVTTKKGCKNSNQSYDTQLVLKGRVTSYEQRRMKWVSQQVDPKMKYQENGIRLCDVELVPFNETDPIVQAMVRSSQSTILYVED